MPSSNAKLGTVEKFKTVGAGKLLLPLTKKAREIYLDIHALKILEHILASEFILIHLQRLNNRVLQKKLFFGENCKF